MKSDVDRGYAAGFKKYPTKPYDVREIIRFVNEALEKSDLI